MTSKLKTDVLETVSGSGTIALTNQLTGMTSASMPSGSVIQVVSANTSTTVTIATTTFTDTGITATITPSYTSSKILVMATVALNHGNQEGIGIKLLRGSTQIYANGNQFSFLYSDGVVDQYRRGSIYELDSPSTTSATTYKIQAGTYENRSIAISGGSGRSEIILMEIKG